MSSSLNCPACGGPIENINPHSRSVSCSHCANLLYFNNSQWVSGGKFPTEIEAPPLLRVDRQGSFDGNAFRVAGRIRLAYDEGHWDEWWLEFENGEDRWLEEDDGSYYFHQSVPLDTTTDAVNNLGVGKMFPAGDKSWFVTESGEASISGVQGQVPVTLQPGFLLRYYDAVTDGKTISIEVWGNEVEASLAQKANPSSFLWHN